MGVPGVMMTSMNPGASVVGGIASTNHHHLSSHAAALHQHHHHQQQQQQQQFAALQQQHRIAAETNLRAFLANARKLLATGETGDVFDVLFRLWRLCVLGMGWTSPQGVSPARTAEYALGVRAAAMNLERSSQGEAVFGLDPGARSRNEVIVYQSEWTREAFGNIASLAPGVNHHPRQPQQPPPVFDDQAFQNTYRFVPFVEIWGILMACVEAIRGTQSRPSSTRSSVFFRQQAPNGPRECVVSATYVIVGTGDGAMLLSMRVI